MIRSLMFPTIIFLAVLAVLGGNPFAPQAAARESAPGDLFYNFYVPPMGYQSVGAELYPCPRPTPPVVGWTYITYQPLMPHEFLYHHHRTYSYFHSDDGRTKTRVWWH
jgi:hypothetical protein